jgi:hypothetical protein
MFDANLDYELWTAEQRRRDERLERRRRLFPGDEKK